MAGEKAPMVMLESSPEEMEILKTLLEKKRLRMGRSEEAKMNMTPMIDIVFLLIFFFMVVTDLSSMELEQLTLPYAKNAEDDPKKGDKKRIVVNVNKDGDIVINRIRYTPPELLIHLKKVASKHPSGEKLPNGVDIPDVTVRVRGDANAEYKVVQAVMKKCMEAYIWQLSFGASPPIDEGLLSLDF